MKSKPPVILILFCMALLSAQSVLSQSAGGRPRRVSLQSAPISKNLLDVDEGAAEAAAFESMIPRDGLKFYFEVRNGGLARLAEAASASSSLSSLLSLAGKSLDRSDLAGFALRNLSALSASRLALAGYAMGGAVLLIEAASSEDAEKLKAEIGRLLAGQTETSVRRQDRRVLAGARSRVERMLESGAFSTLADDREFLKARSRFSADPFFAYVETGASLVPWPTGAGGNSSEAAAYASLMGVFGPMPYGVAIGGQLHSDSTSLRALVMYDKSKKQGLFSSILSAAQMGQLSASAFAASDTELFIDLMIDWNKLYEALESVFAMVLSTAQSPAGNQQRAGAPRSVDMLAALESSLGFSIKRDLIPTLGNEVAISLHGFSDLMRSKSSARPAARKPAPRILFMLSVRDPLLFEKLFARLIAPRGRRVSRPFAQLSHRGATIRYNKDIAYTITGGFFIAGASASEIRRAIDARALNTSLASRPEFASAMGASRPVMMQAYLSPAVSGSLLDSTKGTAAGAAKGARSPLALTIMSDEDGFLMEMRVPTELALAGLASMAANRPAAYGITSSPSSGARRRAGRRSPTFTDDDLIRRKP